MTADPVRALVDAPLAARVKKAARRDQGARRTALRKAAAVCVAPAAVFLLVLIAYPLAQVLWSAFHYVNLVNPTVSGFARLDNFATVLGDEHFWPSLWRTGEWTVVSVAGEYAARPRLRGGARPADPGAKRLSRHRHHPLGHSDRRRRAQLDLDADPRLRRPQHLDGQARPDGEAVLLARQSEFGAPHGLVRQHLAQLSVLYDQPPGGASLGAARNPGVGRHRRGRADPALRLHHPCRSSRSSR